MKDTDKDSTYFLPNGDYRAWVLPIRSMFDGYNNFGIFIGTDLLTNHTIGLEVNAEIAQLYIDRINADETLNCKAFLLESGSADMQHILLAKKVNFPAPKPVPTITDVITELRDIRRVLERSDQDTPSWRNAWIEGALKGYVHGTHDDWHGNEKARAATEWDKSEFKALLNACGDR